MVLYELTRSLSSQNCQPFYTSLTAVGCADFMEEGHIYVRDKQPFDLPSLLENNVQPFDISNVPRLLLDISTQIETLWSIGYSLLPFDEKDVYRIGNSFCVLAPEKVASIEPSTNLCSLKVPIRLGEHMAPEVCSCMRLPCLTFCGKYSGLYSLGIVARNIMGDNFDPYSHIGIVVKKLTYDKPSRRVPVVF
jgi:hypothetical protein